MQAQDTPASPLFQNRTPSWRRAKRAAPRGSPGDARAGEAPPSAGAKVARVVKAPVARKALRAGDSPQSRTSSSSESEPPPSDSPPPSSSDSDFGSDDASDSERGASGAGPVDPPRARGAKVARADVRPVLATPTKAARARAAAPDSGGAGSRRSTPVRGRQAEQVGGAAAAGAAADDDDAPVLSQDGSVVGAEDARPRATPRATAFGRELPPLSPWGIPVTVARQGKGRDGFIAELRGPQVDLSGSTGVVGRFRVAGGAIQLDLKGQVFEGVPYTACSCAVLTVGSRSAQLSNVTDVAVAMSHQRDVLATLRGITTDPDEFLTTDFYADVDVNREHALAAKAAAKKLKRK